MKLAMAIVQSSITGNWNYCPESARQLLKLEYDDKASLPTAEAAEKAALRDPNIPAGSTFTRYPTPLQAGMRAAGSAARRWRVAERAGILDAMIRETGMSNREASDALDGARVAVFDDYISDGPGYTGTVALVLYSGGPELVDVFVWRDGICERVKLAIDDEMTRGGA